MRLASKDARDFQKLAEGFGWELVGPTSNGHLRWEHDQYGELVTSATPRTWWWAQKDLYAAMDMAVPVRTRHRKARPVRARQEPHKINALLRHARRNDHRMYFAFAERILDQCDGDLDRAIALLELLIERADRIRARRKTAQPWEARTSRRSLTTGVPA